MKPVFIILVSFCALFFFFNNVSYSQSEGWLQLRKDPQCTGYTSSVVPLTVGLEKQILLQGNFIAVPVVDNQGNIYASSTLDTLYAISSDYQIKWKRKLGRLSWNANSINSHPTLSPDGSTVYIFDWNDGKLNALRTSDGSLLWKSEEFIKDYGWGIPIIASNGDIFLVHGHIICISPSGNTKWRIQNEQYHLWGALSNDERSFYVGSYSKLFSLDPLTGAGNYVNFTTQSAPYPVVVAGDGKLYGGRGRAVRKFNMPSGLVDWTYNYAYGDAEKLAYDKSRNRIYLANNDTIHALNPDGAIIWKKEILNAFFGDAAGPAIDGNGNIIIQSANSQSNNFNIYIIDWQTGNILKELNAVGQPIYSPPTIAHGKIYAGLVNGIVIFGNATGIDNDENEIKEFVLGQNYPNPFNTSTRIEYELPYPSFVKIKVYDLLGNEISTLVNDFLSNGKHHFNFNSDEFNLSSGVYFYRIIAGNFSETRKMILMR